MSAFRSWALVALALAGCASGDHAGSPGASRSEASASPATHAAPASAPARDPRARPDEVPFPPDNAPTEARVALGKTLFFDPRMSGTGKVSCGTCHIPSMGWTDGLPTAIGDGGKHLPRNTPTILNTAYQATQMWDGRVKTLEDQALIPMRGGPMNLPIEQMIERLKAVPGYPPMFEQAYPGEGVTAAAVGKALAAFERTIVSPPAPFDRWRSGDENAVSDQAKQGFDLFKGKARCALCHQGFNFTDNGFHNIGVRWTGQTEDLGHYPYRKLDAYKGAFKTPTLRDVALTAPYMHNGVYQTLDEVVDHYDRGGDVKDNLSPTIKPLGLSAEEKQALVAFLKSLTGPQVEITLPQLPPG